MVDATSLESTEKELFWLVGRWSGGRSQEIGMGKNCYFSNC